MPTYLYEIQEGPDKDTIIEIEHPISQAALVLYNHNGRSVAVKRVIAGNTNFHLKGDCWARTNYERGIQSGGSVSAQDRAKFGKT